MRVAIAAALMGLFVMTATAGAPISGVESQETQDVIVVFNDDVGDPAEAARALTNAHGGELRFVYEHAIKGFSATLTTAAVTALQHNPQVAFINENRPVEAFEESVPTGVSRIDGPVAHGNGVTGEGVRVAIIDTGIDSNHPDLEANLDFGSGYNCVDPNALPEDDQGHGTHVAGTVAAADNDQGVIGVAPAATLVPMKVLDGSGSGTWEQVICGIDRVTALNVNADPGDDIHVANMSLGGSGSHDGSTCSKPGDDAMYQAICSAIDSGTTFVVAAGNDSSNADGFVPAAYPEVVTVSAYSDTDGSTNDAGCTGFAIFVTCDEVFASFSNYGDIVDVIAPGVNINSTTYDGGYGTKSGTSMASPHAAGVAALVLQQNPGLSASQVAAHLRDFGQCPDTDVNGGSEDCVDQGLWENDPDSWTEPMSHAAFATSSSADTNSPPTASFTFSCTDLACDFDASGSSDSDGTISSYDWDFGDGNTGTGATVSHTYASADTYIVTLTVTDDAGATDSSSQDVTVSDSTTNSAPTASFTSKCTDLACDFDGSESSDSDGTISSYDWDFGDGTTGSGAAVSHTYAAGGTYTVTLTVTDDGGATDSSSQDVTVTEPASGDFTLSTTGYKVRGLQKADLTWDGATSTDVDIYRDGTLLTTTANDGFFTDNIDQRGSGSYTYQVCEAGTEASTCSNEATVTFG